MKKKHYPRDLFWCYQVVLATTIFQLNLSNIVMDTGLSVNKNSFYNTRNEIQTKKYLHLKYLMGGLFKIVNTIFLNHNRNSTDHF